MHALSLEVVLATRNQKKCAELRSLLAPHGLLVRASGDFPDLPEIEEDGSTFAENAAKKARQTAQAVGRWTIGEDSGLCADALGAAPGVYSARYSGPAATDTANNALLVANLSGIEPEKRTAHYVCHVALADPTGSLRVQFEETCAGRIVETPRGSHGFGYDPHFLIPEYHRTFAELSPLTKRQLSHRGRALRRLVPELLRVTGHDGGRG